MTFHSYREQALNSWGVYTNGNKDPEFSVEQLQLGCLQQIADSLKRMERMLDDIWREHTTRGREEGERIATKKERMQRLDHRCDVVWDQLIPAPEIDHRSVKKRRVSWVIAREFAGDEWMDLCGEELAARLWKHRGIGSQARIRIAEWWDVNRDKVVEASRG